MICTIKMKFEGHEKYIGRWGMGEMDREKAFEISVNLDSYTTFRLLGSHWIQLCPHWVVDICLTVYLLCLLFPASALMWKFPTQITFITSGARVLTARVTSVRKNSLRSMAWYLQTPTVQNQCRNRSRGDRYDNVAERVVHIKKIALCSVTCSSFLPSQIYT